MKPDLWVQIHRLSLTTNSCCLGLNLIRATCTNSWRLTQLVLSSNGHRHLLKEKSSLFEPGSFVSELSIHHLSLWQTKLMDQTRFSCYTLGWDFHQFLADLHNEVAGEFFFPLCFCGHHKFWSFSTAPAARPGKDGGIEPDCFSPHTTSRDTMTPCFISRSSSGYGSDFDPSEQDSEAEETRETEKENTKGNQNHIEQDDDDDACYTLLPCCHELSVRLFDNLLQNDEDCLCCSHCGAVVDSIQ